MRVPVVAVAARRSVTLDPWVMLTLLPLLLTNTKVSPALNTPEFTVTPVPLKMCFPTSEAAAVVFVLCGIFR